MPEPRVVEYRLSPAALTDLDAIWEYTARTWSVSQAETYIRGLAADMDLLVQHPGIARERTEISPPVRLYRSASYLPHRGGVAGRAAHRACATELGCVPE